MQPQLQLVNMIGTRRDPSNRRKSALFKKAVMLGKRRIPNAKAAMITPRVYVEHRKKIDMYVKSGMLVWRAPSPKVNADFWKEVESLLEGQEVILPGVTLARPANPLDGVEPEAVTKAEEVVVIEAPEPVKEDKAEVAPEPEQEAKAEPDKEPEEKVAIIEEPAAEKVEAAAEPAPKKTRARKTTTRRGGRKPATKKTASKE